MPSHRATRVAFGFLCGALCARVFAASTDVSLALDGLPRQDVRMTIHDKALQCSGVALVDLLRHAGAMSDAPSRGEALRRVVVLDARDKYRVVFSLGELDPSLGNRRAFVVDRCDDKVLDDATGPLRLLVPDDARAARSLRQLESIRVEDLP